MVGSWLNSFQLDLYILLAGHLHTNIHSWHSIQKMDVECKQILLFEAPILAMEPVHCNFTCTMFSMFKVNVLFSMHICLLDSNQSQQKFYYLSFLISMIQLQCKQRSFGTPTTNGTRLWNFDYDVCVCFQFGQLSVTIVTQIFYVFCCFFLFVHISCFCWCNQVKTGHNSYRTSSKRCPSQSAFLFGVL